MELTISRVHLSENLEEEFAEFEVVADTNLSKFAVADITYDEDGNISNVHRHFYRFPSINAAKGDTVWLYTGKGGNKYFNLIKMHYLYWNSDNPIWNKSGDIVYLYKIEETAQYKVPLLDKI